MKDIVVIFTALSPFKPCIPEWKFNTGFPKPSLFEFNGVIAVEIVESGNPVILLKQAFCNMVSDKSRSSCYEYFRWLDIFFTV